MAYNQPPTPGTAQQYPKYVTYSSNRISGQQTQNTKSTGQGLNNYQRRTVQSYNAENKPKVNIQTVVTANIPVSKQAPTFNGTNASSSMNNSASSNANSSNPQNNKNKYKQLSQDLKNLSQQMRTIVSTDTNKNSNNRVEQNNPRLFNRMSQRSAVSNEGTTSQRQPTHTRQVYRRVQLYDEGKSQVIYNDGNASNTSNTNQSAASSANIQDSNNTRTNTNTNITDSKPSTSSATSPKTGHHYVNPYATNPTDNSNRNSSATNTNNLNNPVNSAKTTSNYSSSTNTNSNVANTIPVVNPTSASRPATSQEGKTYQTPHISVNKYINSYNSHANSIINQRKQNSNSTYTNNNNTNTNINSNINDTNSNIINTSNTNTNTISNTNKNINNINSNTNTNTNNSNNNTNTNINTNNNNTNIKVNANANTYSNNISSNTNANTNINTSTNIMNANTVNNTSTSTSNNIRYAPAANQNNRNHENRIDNTKSANSTSNITNNAINSYTPTVTTTTNNSRVVYASSSTNNTPNIPTTNYPSTTITAINANNNITSASNAQANSPSKASNINNAYNIVNSLYSNSPNIKIIRGNSGSNSQNNSSNVSPVKNDSTSNNPAGNLTVISTTAVNNANSTTTTYNIVRSNSKQEPSPVISNKNSPEKAAEQPNQPQPPQPSQLKPSPQQPKSQPSPQPPQTKPTPHPSRLKPSQSFQSYPEVSSPVPIEYNPEKTRLLTENASININKKNKTEPDILYDDYQLGYEFNKGNFEDGYNDDGNPDADYGHYMSPRFENIANKNINLFVSNKNQPTYAVENRKNPKPAKIQNLFDSVSLNQFFSKPEIYEQNQQPLQQSSSLSQKELKLNQANQNGIKKASYSLYSDRDPNQKQRSSPQYRQSILASPQLNKVNSAASQYGMNRYQYSPKSQTYNSLYRISSSQEKLHRQLQGYRRVDRASPYQIYQRENSGSLVNLRTQTTPTKSVKQTYQQTRNSPFVVRQGNLIKQNLQNQRNRMSEQVDSIKRLTGEDSPRGERNNFYVRKSQDLYAKNPRIQQSPRSVTKTPSIRYVGQDQRYQNNQMLQQLIRQKQLLRQQKQRIQYQLQAQSLKNRTLQLKCDKISQQYQQVIRRQQIQRERVMALQRQVYTLKAKKHSGFDDILKNQMEQTCKIKQVIQQKNDQISRLNEIIAVNRRTTQQAINNANVEKVKYLSQRNQQSQMHEIALLNKDNEIKRLSHALQTMQSKLKVAIKQNKAKDVFLQQHIVGRTSNDNQREYINSLLSKYQIEFPTNNLAEKLLQQQKQIQCLKRVIQKHKL